MILPAPAWNLAALLGLAAVLVWTCFRIGRTDRIAQLIVVAGIALRLGAGVGLFVTSYYDVEWMRHVRVGGGFWEPDAQTYYTRAAEASRHGLEIISSGEASPAYVKALALAMDVFGVTPLTGVYLNVVCYVALCVLLVAALGGAHDAAGRSALRLMLVCFTLSPALILSSGQSLKDQFFISWLVVSALAVFPVLRWLAGEAVQPSALWSGLPLLAVAVAVMSGVRPYVGMFMIAVLAAVVLARVFRSSQVPVLRRMARSAAVLVLLWAAFAQGAGAYYVEYENRLLGMVGITGMRRSATSMVESAREGFVRTGGRTNIARPVSEGEGLAVSAASAVAAFAIGVIAMLVPVAIAEAVGILDIDPGGMVRVIDIDTLFVTLSCGAIILFARRHRAQFAHARLYVMYTASIALLMGVLMAYVVTNLGTLYRLRTMPAGWVWLLPLALSPVLVRDRREPAVIERDKAAPVP